MFPVFSPDLRAFFLPQKSPRHWRGWKKRLGQGGDVDPELIGQYCPVSAVGFMRDCVFRVKARSPHEIGCANTMRHPVNHAAFCFGEVFHGRPGDVVGRQIVRVPPVRRRRGRGEESPKLIPPEPVMGGDVAGAILHGVSPANHGYDTPGGHDAATRGH